MRHLSLPKQREAMMEEQPRHILADIIARYGPTVCEEPRLSGLLNDYCHGQYQRERFVLVNALRQRIAAELIATSEGVPKELLLARLTQRLEEHLGFTTEVARWAVESWAVALGKLSPQELTISAASHRQQAREASFAPPPLPPIDSAQIDIPPSPNGAASLPWSPPPRASGRRMWPWGVLLAVLVMGSYGLWQDAQHTTLRQKQEMQPLAKEEETQAVTHFAVTCIRNGTETTINYLYRWGDGEWEHERLMPWKQNWHAWQYQWPNEHRSPQLQMRFDADLSSSISWITYNLESYASPQKDDCRSGKNYLFRPRSANHIDLEEID